MDAMPSDPGPAGHNSGHAAMPTEAIDFSQQPLVFTHIPKTAGTTLNGVLEAAFPENCLFHLQRLERETLSERLADPNLHVCGGHLKYLQLSAAFADTTRRPLYITILRDPVERILSAYCYARESVEDRRWHDLASRHDINAFIAVMAENHRQFLISKQCRFVGTVARADADQAMDSLKRNYAVVGLQDDLESFLRRLETRLQFSLPRCEPRNRSANRVTRDALDKKSLRILDRTTREDRRLYELVLAWLAK